MLTSLYQILSKCNSLFPELFNQLDTQGDGPQQQLALPPPEASHLVAEEYGVGDDHLVPEEDNHLIHPLPVRDLEQLPPPPDWSVRENTLEVDPTLRSPPAQCDGHHAQVWLHDRQGDHLEGGGENHENQNRAVRLTPENLNFPAIQEDLEGHQVRSKILLMQALRWVR